MCHPTEVKVHDIQVGKTLQFDPGDLLITDRGYIDYPWLHSLHQKGVWFCDPTESQCLSSRSSETLENPDPDRVLATKLFA